MNVEITPQNFKEWVIENINTIVDEVIKQSKVLDENGLLRTDDGEETQPTTHSVEGIIQSSITTEEEEWIEWSDDLDHYKEQGFSKEDVSEYLTRIQQGL
jgi:trans-2-enoyl-CoA reductase